MVYSFPVFYLPRQVIFVKIIFFVIIIPPFLDFVDLILALFQPFEKGWAKTFKKRVIISVEAAPAKERGGSGERNFGV